MKNTRTLPFVLLALLVLLPGLAVSQETGFSLPRYEKVKLKNGLTVYLME
jgi:hypothetical protein